MEVLQISVNVANTDDWISRSAPMRGSPFINGFNFPTWIGMSTDENTTSPTLLERIRDHEDGHSWNQFCEVYSPMLYDYCRRKGLQPNDCSDVVQEVLIRVAKGIRSFDYDRSKGRFRGWLSTIVHREISRFKTSSPNKPSVEQQPEISSDEVSWGEYFQAYVMRVALERCQQHFSPETWLAFSRVWLNSESPKSVAAKMNRNLDFVYLSKSRVLGRLRLEVEMLAEESGL